MSDEHERFTYDEDALYRMGASIDLVLNGRVESEDRTMGWLLLIWPFHDPAIGTYLSNGERATTITALEEIVKQLKAGVKGGSGGV